MPPPVAFDETGNMLPEKEEGALIWRPETVLLVVILLAEAAIFELLL